MITNPEITEQAAGLLNQETVGNLETIQVSEEEAWDFLQSRDRFAILCHKSPDGDTLGSGLALVYTLRRQGKQANVYCSDPFPENFSFHFLWTDYTPQEFEPETVVSVDVADETLLGPGLSQFKGKVELALDHHISHRAFAQRLLLRPKAAATCQLVYEMFEKNHVEIDRLTASSLYVGIFTDTGGFRYSSTTAQTHLALAGLYACEIPAARINRLMMEKTPEQQKLDAFLNAKLELLCGGRCSLLVLGYDDLFGGHGIPLEEFDGASSYGVRLKGVEIGVTIKEKQRGEFKISLRSSGAANVSEICEKFGGGGHISAAGCCIADGRSINEARECVLREVTACIERLPLPEPLRILP